MPQENSKRKGLFMHKEKRIFIPLFFFIAIVPLFMIYNSNSTNLFIGFFVDESQHFGFAGNVNLRAWEIPIEMLAAFSICNVNKLNVSFFGNSSFPQLILVRDKDLRNGISA